MLFGGKHGEVRGLRYSPKPFGGAQALGVNPNGVIKKDPTIFLFDRRMHHNGEKENNDSSFVHTILVFVYVNSTSFEDSISIYRVKV